MKPRVLIVGGTGVFGSRLARRLIAEAEVEVIVAGRNPTKLAEFQARYGGETQRVDRDATHLEAQLAALRVAIVVDAAGPFQAYGSTDSYRLARAALASDAHYLDFSDDASFTAGISALDAEAKAAGRVILSGVSSVPSISAAAVHALATGLQGIDTIDTVILPGNRAPRGLSVVQAILAQAGQPLRVWRDGASAWRRAWTRVERVSLDVPGAKPLRNRWASWIGAPDLALFGPHFGARTVRFRAGLELAVLHLGLVVLAWLSGLFGLRSLAPLARPLRAMAACLHAFGSDRGGMRVCVSGRDAEGLPQRRRWTLIAEAGDGPEIPAVPAYVLIHKFLRGELATGARAALDELRLEEIERAFAPFAIVTARDTETLRPLYARILGPEHWGRLPAPLRLLHAPLPRCEHRGRASVERGTHPLAGPLASLMRFPTTAEDVALTVTIAADDAGRERWTRSFGSRCFHSVLTRSAVSGLLVERFGTLAVEMRLPSDDRRLSMQIEGVRWFGIPLPRLMWPTTTAIETVDAQGRFRFDVEIGVPIVGRLVRYRGWLRPASKSHPP